MNDDLGNRMKGYENVTKNYLLRRTPVIVRVDGKAFHTFTKKINHFNDVSLITSPFSERLHVVMSLTASSMCHHMQNAIFAYTQSDEISILLKDWTELNTDQWFGGGVQKIASVSGAMAASYFNYILNSIFRDVYPAVVAYDVQSIPLFDARVFNLPKEEVTNYFIWRQQDATRNSINMYARFFFTQKELHGKSVAEVMDMLMLKRQVNWNDLETWKKRGTSVIPTPDVYSSISPVIIDDENPIFTEDRHYIERYL